MANEVDGTVHADLARLSASLFLLYVGAALGLDGPNALAREPVLFVAPAALAAVAVVAWRSRAGPAGAFAVVAPLALWPLTYDGFVRVASLAPERFVDRALAALDAWLFRRLPGPPAWPLGGSVEEVANALYASYYAVIPLGALWLWRSKGVDAAARYALALLATEAACATVWLLLPAGGYHLGGSPLSAAAGPSTALVRAIYAWNPHYAAAFPSSHVALAVAAALVLRGHGASRAWLAWSAGISFATIYGQYHYAVDTPPAVVAALVGVGFAYRALAAERVVTLYQSFQAGFGGMASWAPARSSAQRQR